MDFPKLGTSKLRGAALLLQIAKIILAEPRRLNMYGWGSKVSPEYASTHSTLPPCGTVGCIAGWAGFLAEGRIGYSADGRRLLGISVEQGNRLFFTSGWPEHLSNKYASAYGPNAAQTRAEATVEMINIIVAEIKAENLKARRERYNEKRRQKRALLVSGVKRDESGKVIAFDINRLRWQRGRAFGSQISALINEQGNMCCLGFYSAACNVDMKKALNVDYPTQLVNLPAEMEWLNVSGQNGYRPLDRYIAEINDDKYSSEGIRESKIQEHFAAQGITVNFIN